MAEYNWGVNEAVKHNLTKVHIPLTCSHGPGDLCDSFFGVGVDAEYTQEEIDLAMELGHLKRIDILGTPTPSKMAEFVKEHPEDNVVFYFEETRSTSDYANTRGWWREKLLKAQKTTAWEQFAGVRYNPDVVNVALHLRRGDIMKSVGVPGKESIMKRYTVNQFYIDAFTTLLSLFPPGTLEGYFFSEGDPKDFQDILDAHPTAHLMLTGTALSDLRSLTESDILVTAKSGYSHLAATLSDVMVVAGPFWGSYAYLPSVVFADEKSSAAFDAAEFAAVWNNRTAEERKGAIAVVPKGYVPKRP